MVAISGPGWGINTSASPSRWTPLLRSLQALGGLGLPLARSLGAASEQRGAGGRVWGLPGRPLLAAGFASSLPRRPLLAAVLASSLPEGLLLPVGFASSLAGRLLLAAGVGFFAGRASATTRGVCFSADILLPRSLRAALVLVAGAGQTRSPAGLLAAPPPLSFSTPLISSPTHFRPRARHTSLVCGIFRSAKFLTMGKDKNMLTAIQRRNHSYRFSAAATHMIATAQESAQVAVTAFLVQNCGVQRRLKLAGAVR